MNWRILKAFPKYAIAIGVVLLSTGLFGAWWFFKRTMPRWEFAKPDPAVVAEIKKKAEELPDKLGWLALVGGDLYDISTGEVIFKNWLRGIPMRWRSEITDWKPPHYFVDEQRIGPYRRWHHEHQFEATDGGTICRDIVDYAVPGGFLVDRWFVRPDILKIFSFRWHKLRELFPASTATSFDRPLARKH